MWILLMIVFNQPFEVGRVDVLGTYADRDRCMLEHGRAFELKTPQPTNFGCVQLKEVREANATFHQRGDGVPMLRRDGHGPGGP